MNYQIIQGQTGLVNPSTSILDTGWVINGNTATHGSCNAGTMVSNDFGLIIGRSYVFTYTVSNLTSGGVRLIAGTTNGIYHTANGTYTEMLVMTNNIYLSFYSDGGLTISNLSFYDLITGNQPGRTISFREGEDKWVSEYSYQPEAIVKFIDKLFTFNNGTLWQHNTNSIVNNFYGVQYSSYIQFIFNADYKNNKLWYNLRFDSNGGWYVSNMQVPPNDQFPNGMQSVLTKKNIKSLDGKLFADILRDMNDPNFNNITDPQLRNAVALFQGRMMQGEVLIVTLQNDDTTLASIDSVEAYYSDVKKSI